MAEINQTPNPGHNVVKARNWWQSWPRQLVLGLAGFMLFCFALGIMKVGAKSLAPFIRGQLSITNTADSLGLGWLMAYLVQSGSPVAAVAIAMLSAGTLSPPQAFTMIAGSRLGASLVVLQIGFLYALRERDRWTSLSAGVLSLLLTGSTFLLTLPLGLFILERAWLDGVNLSVVVQLGAGLGRGIDALVGPFVQVLPGWALFLFGTGLVVLSFKLFDQALPKIGLEKTDLGRISRLVYRPEIMFLMGLVVTFITMSVSISVGLLVPLSVRGYMRRENIIAYILGANVSTFVDTLMAAILLGDAGGVAVVLVHMLCAALLSVLVVLFAYHWYERTISSALDMITRRARNFAIFLAITFAVPVLLILL